MNKNVLFITLMVMNQLSAMHTDALAPDKYNAEIAQILRAAHTTAEEHAEALLSLYHATHTTPDLPAADILDDVEKQTDNSEQQPSLTTFASYCFKNNLDKFRTIAKQPMTHRTKTTTLDALEDSVSEGVEASDGSLHTHAQKLLLDASALRIKDLKTSVRKLRASVNSQKIQKYAVSIIGAVGTIAGALISVYLGTSTGCPDVNVHFFMNNSAI